MRRQTVWSGIVASMATQPAIGFRPRGRPPARGKTSRSRCGRAARRSWRSERPGSARSRAGSPSTAVQILDTSVTRGSRFSKPRMKVMIPSAAKIFQSAPTERRAAMKGARTIARSPTPRPRRTERACALASVQRTRLAWRRRQSDGWRYPSTCRVSRRSPLVRSRSQLRGGQESGSVSPCARRACPSRGGRSSLIEATPWQGSPKRQSPGPRTQKSSVVSAEIGRLDLTATFNVDLRSDGRVTIARGTCLSSRSTGISNDNRRNQRREMMAMCCHQRMITLHCVEFNSLATVCGRRVSFHLELDQISELQVQRPSLHPNESQRLECDHEDLGHKSKRDSFGRNVLVDPSL